MIFCLIINLCCWHNQKSAQCFYKVQSSSINTLVAESYFIYFLQACFTRYRDHQGVDLIKIIRG